MQSPRLSAVVLLAACLMCGCDGLTRINGVIIDPDGVGVSGAKIHVEATEKFQGRLGRPRDATTLQNGEYDIDFSHSPVAGEFNLTVTHPDFTDFKEVISIGSHVNHKIELKRLDPKTVEAKAAN